MTKSDYDPEADAFYARFAPEDREIAETREVAPGVMIDVDLAGELVGLEVLGVAVRAAGTYARMSVHRGGFPGSRSERDGTTRIVRYAKEVAGPVVEDATVTRDERAEVNSP